MPNESEGKKERKFTVNGKTYTYYYEYKKHHWTVKDLRRVYKAVKKNPNNGAGINNKFLIRLAFDILFELAPYFKNWICIWIKIESAIGFFVTTLGLLKIIAILIRWAKWLEARLAIGWLARFEKRYAIVVAFVTAIIVTLTIIYDTIEFISGQNTFSKSILESLDEAICEGNDSGFISDLIKGVSQAVAESAFNKLLNASEEDDDVVLD